MSKKLLALFLITAVVVILAPAGCKKDDASNEPVGIGDDHSLANPPDCLLDPEAGLFVWFDLEALDSEAVESIDNLIGLDSLGGEAGDIRENVFDPIARLRSAGAKSWLVVMHMQEQEKMCVQLTAKTDRDAVAAVFASMVRPAPQPYESNGWLVFSSSGKPAAVEKGNTWIPKALKQLDPKAAFVWAGGLTEGGLDELGRNTGRSPASSSYRQDDFNMACKVFPPLGIAREAEIDQWFVISARNAGGLRLDAKIDFLDRELASEALELLDSFADQLESVHESVGDGIDPDLAASISRLEKLYRKKRAATSPSGGLLDISLTEREVKDIIAPKESILSLLMSVEGEDAEMLGEAMTADIPELRDPRQRALDNAALAQIRMLETTLAMYALDMGDYPTTDQGLDALYDAPADLVTQDRWDGPYINRPAPLDPWGNAYRYEYPGTQSDDRFDLWSMGSDQIHGTEDDIGNWAP